MVPDETLVPIAVSTDGKHLFAGDYTPSSRRFIEIDTSTGNRRTIMIFHGSQDQVAGANFDGRWLVWSVGHSFSNLSDWSLYAWDSQTNQVIDVAQVQRVNGKPIDGPFVMPVVSHGLMAWTQSTPGGNTELHLYTLASRTARVIDRNHPGAPIFAWPLMIWEEPRGNLTPSPGTRPDAKLTVANAMTGKRLPTPAVLANVQPWYLVGAPGMVAWVELDRRTIWLWNVGTPQPERIYVAPENEYAEFPSFGNHVLAWAGESAMYVYDLRAKGPVVQVTPQYGDVFANGSALVVSYNIRGTKNPNGDRVIVVDYDKLLPPPPCTS